MLTKAQWEHLIPHRGAMSLLDTVVAWDDTQIHLQAISHRETSNPLRRDGLLPAVHLCEYGAQAIAVHGGLLAQRAGKMSTPKLLVALRAVQLLVARIDTLAQPLDVHAHALLVDAHGAQYAFRIEHAGTPLAAGRASVMQVPT